MGHIVVGLDGSPNSRAALLWAAHLAGRIGADLHVIAAWQYPPPLDEWEAHPTNYGFLPLIPTSDNVEQAARLVVDDAIEELSTECPSLTVTSSVVQASPSAALVKAAADAELLVVGRHHRAGLSELALGSVPRTCAQHARCPVVVVPSEASAEPGDGAPDRTTGDRQVGHSALPGPGGGTKN